jgi:hypothetical protein
LHHVSGPTISPPLPTMSVMGNAGSKAPPIPHTLGPVDLTDPARLTAFVPVRPQPKAECRHGHDAGLQFTLVELLEGGFWNGWPCGPFAIDLDHATFMKHGELGVQWAVRNCQGSNGKKNRCNVYADSIAGGKESYRKCFGVLKCTSAACHIITRPKVSALEKQLTTETCFCGARLLHFDCGSKSFLIEWGQKGADITTRRYRYINGEPHNHSRIPYVVHMTKQEEEDSHKHIGNNMEKTALEMYEGGNSLDGPTPRVPALAQAALNPDSWRYRVGTARKGAKSENGSWFINRFHGWIKNHADEVRIRINTVGQADVCVIAFHSNWMRDQLLPKQELVEQPLPLEGMLTDGAHKYWSDPNSILITTTTFCPGIDRWVPCMFSLADGATAEHYKYHFTAVIESIVEAAQEYARPITDDMFALVSSKFLN